VVGLSRSGCWDLFGFYIFRVIPEADFFEEWISTIDDFIKAFIQHHITTIHDVLGKNIIISKSRRTLPVPHLENFIQS